MGGRRLVIEEKCRDRAFSAARPGHFRLVDGPPVEAEIVLRDERLSLYCIDDAGSRALFVETPEPFDASRSTFMYQSQYDAALSVVSLPLEAFQRAARDLPLDSRRVALLQSTGRCGSTLMGKALGAIDGVGSWPEPDAFTNLSFMRTRDGSRDRELAELGESCLKLMSLRLSETSLQVFKFRSQVTEIADLLCERLPGVKTLFMYRRALPWLNSVCRSLLRDDPVHDEAYRRDMQQRLSGCRALIAENAAPEQPMTTARLWTLEWVSSMESYLELYAAGRNVAALRYEDLQRQPESALRAALAFLGIEVPDWRPVRAVLSRDSQEGTSAARSAARGAQATPAEFLEEAARVVASRPRLGGPDPLLPNTLAPAGARGAAPAED